MFKIVNLTMKECPNLKVRTAGFSVTNLQKRKAHVQKRAPERIKRFRSTSSMLERINSKESNSTLLVNPLTYFENRIKNISSVRDYSTSSFADCAAVSSSHADTDELQNQRNVSPLSTVLVSLDCEMVECLGNINSLARCSMVDYHGKVTLDVYVKPVLPVTDYRTRYSGIRKFHLKTQNSVGFDEAIDMIRKNIRDKIVVGHSLNNDFNAMKICKPKYRIDISNLSSLKAKILTDSSSNPVSLKRMAKHLLHQDIQIGEHCSVIDARTTMELFKLVETEWWSLNKEHYTDFWKNNNTMWMEDKYWPDDVKNE